MLTAATNAIRKTLLAGAGLALLAIPAAHAQAPATPAAANVFKQAYGAWTLLCAPVKTGGEACEIQQALRNEKNQQVARASAFKDGAETDLRIDLPIGVYLRKNPSLQVDKGATTDALSYLRCSPRACMARMTAAPAFLDAMRKGADLTVTFNLTGQRTAAVKFSLNGYADAEKALLARVK